MARHIVLNATQKRGFRTLRLEQDEAREADEKSPTRGPVRVEFADDEEGEKLRKIFGRTQPHGSYDGFASLPDVNVLHIPALPGLYEMELLLDRSKLQGAVGPITVKAEGEPVAEPLSDQDESVSFEVAIDDVFLDVEIDGPDADGVVRVVEVRPIDGGF